MSLRFAAARTPAGSPMARVLARKPHARPANDNGDASLPRPQTRIDGATRAALRLLASDGLAAADVACANAERARHAGDALSCAWWMEVCSALDPRLARRLAASDPQLHPQAV